MMLYDMEEVIVRLTLFPYRVNIAVSQRLSILFYLE